MQSSRTGERVTDRRRLAFGAFVALLTHSVIAILIITIQPPRATVTDRTSVSVEIRSHPPEPVIKPPPPPALPLPPIIPPIVPHEQKQPAASPTPRVVQPPLPTQPAPHLPQGPEPERSNGSVVTSPRAPPTIDLFPPSALLHGSGISPGAPPAPEEGAGDSPLEAERKHVERGIEKTLTMTQAVTRVSGGLVDPYFRWLKDRVKRTWLSASDEPDDSDPSGAQPIEPPSPADRSFALKWSDGTISVATGLIVLRMVQDHTGHPKLVTVLHSSGSRRLDDTAAAALTRAASASPAPAHGLGLGGDSIESLWRMEARRAIGFCSFTPSPPAGVSPQGDPLVSASQLACSPLPPFDLSMHGVDMDPHPNRVVTKVEYFAVFGGENMPAAH